MLESDLNPMPEEPNRHRGPLVLGAGVLGLSLLGLTGIALSRSEPTAVAPAHNARGDAYCGTFTFYWDGFTASESVLFEVGYEVTFYPSSGGSPFFESGTDHFGPDSGSETIALPPVNGTGSWSSSWNSGGHQGSGSGEFVVTDCAAPATTTTIAPLGSFDAGRNCERVAVHNTSPLLLKGYLEHGLQEILPGSQFTLEPDHVFEFPYTGTDPVYVTVANAEGSGMRLDYPADCSGATPSTTTPTPTTSTVPSLSPPTTPTDGSSSGPSTSPPAPVAPPTSADAPSPLAPVTTPAPTAPGGSSPTSTPTDEALCTDGTPAGNNPDWSCSTGRLPDVETG